VYRAVGIPSGLEASWGVAPQASDTTSHQILQGLAILVRAKALEAPQVVQQRFLCHGDDPIPEPL
jgi:hypothetical protein